jgi:hypothetical protein
MLPIPNAAKWRHIVSRQMAHTHKLVHRDICTAVSEPILVVRGRHSDLKSIGS